MHLIAHAKTGSSLPSLFVLILRKRSKLSYLIPLGIGLSAALRDQTWDDGGLVIDKAVLRVH